MVDGNFQDYVGLTGDTLYHKGAQLDLGSSSATTVGVGFSNSAGQLDLVAIATGDATCFLPPAGGTLAVATQIGITALSAGTQEATSGAVVFSNSNGISFGMSNSSVVTASVASSLTGVNISAGTTSNNLSALTFSNSNGISFGLNASTLTASIATSLTNINVSAGTTSGNLSAITFSNSNGISFGLNASTLTASVATSLTNINVSAGTTSGNLSALVFSNSNGVSFGLNGSTVTASAAGGGGGGGIAIADSVQTATSGTVIFSNSNSVVFGMSLSSVMTASITPGNVVVSNLAVHASEFSNGNGGTATTINWNQGNDQDITLNSGTCTLTFTAPSVGGSKVSKLLLKVIQDGTGGRLIQWPTINWIGGLAPTLSTAAGAIDIITLYYDGTNYWGTYGYNFGTTGTPSPVLTAINVSATNSLGPGAASANLSNLVFSFVALQAGGVQFGMAGSTLTGQVASSLTSINVSAGTTSNNLSALVFSNSNGISFGLNGSTLTAAVAGISSWSNGAIVTSFGGTSNAFMSLQPLPFEYNLTASNLVLLASMSGITNSSGAFSVSLGIYTLNGGTAGSLSSASSTTSQFSWTSGAAYSSFSGINYLNISLNSWHLIPGPYLLAIAISTANSASLTFYGTQSLVTIGSGLGDNMSNKLFPGFSTASVAALPTSFGVSNTSGYVRTGSSVFQQPWVLFQGT